MNGEVSNDAKFEDSQAAVGWCLWVSLQKLSSKERL